MLYQDGENLECTEQERLCINGNLTDMFTPRGKREAGLQYPAINSQLREEYMNFLHATLKGCLPPHWMANSLERKAVISKEFADAVAVKLVVYLSNGSNSTKFEINRVPSENYSRQRLVQQFSKLLAARNDERTTNPLIGSDGAINRTLLKMSKQILSTYNYYY